MPNQQTDYYDVFLIDPDFTIERPKRKLRQGLKKLTGQGSLKAAIGYNAKEGEGNHTSAEDKNLHEIAAAAGSGQALTKEQQKKLSQHSQALGEGDSRDASQHTFYINSSQRRLKLVAKNVVSLSMSGPTYRALTSSLPTATNAAIHRFHGASRSAIGLGRAEPI